MGLKIDIQKIRGFKPEEEQRYRFAAAHMAVAVDGLEFCNWFCKYKFQAYYSKLNKYSTYPTFKAEMLREIRSGKDLFGSADGDIDIDVTLYYKRNNVIGYTYYNKIRTWINNRFFRSYNYGQIAANIFHEYLHNCGYTHSFKWERTRAKTVPYACGYKIRDIVNENIKWELGPNESDYIKPVVKPVKLGFWARVKAWFKRR